MELFPAPPAASPDSPPILTVTEVTQAVRQVLEQALGQVWVEGEVSNFRKQPSGHQYFTLRDEKCQLQCVMFARPGMWKRAVTLADGMCVVAKGMLTVYEARGQYQLNVQVVQAAGAGLLQAKFEALKRRLEAEGLFEPERKRALAKFPAAIGIVTSASGAALRDMLNILSRRAPWIRIVVSSVRVQGEGAAEEIAAAVAEFNRFGSWALPPVDVIVVARGGGSAEDLWEFNEEVVARAIAASEIPVVSAVGHEIDFTISDFVADLRAPTPSAAAEIIAPDRVDLQRGLRQMVSRIDRQRQRVCERMRQHVTNLTRGALFREPQRRLQAAAQRVDAAGEGLRWAVTAKLAARRERVSAMAAVMRQHRPDHQLALRRHQVQAGGSRLSQALKHHLAHDQKRLAAAIDYLRLVSPQAILERGYTITSSIKGELLRSSSEAALGSRIVTRFADGMIESKVQKSSPGHESGSESEVKR